MSTATDCAVPISEALKEYHRFEEDDRRFVYDVNDIVIFEVDPVIWAFYDAAESGDVGSAEAHVADLHGGAAAAEACSDLRKMGLLRPVAQKPPTPTPPKTEMYGVTLNVTHGCNLRCTYCFAKQGDYGLGNSLMTSDTAKKAIDWLADRAGPTKSARVGFFGGEPMMNMPAIRDAIEHADQRLGEQGTAVRYHVTTNGTLLTEKNVKFLAEHKENMDVQVSLDGKAAVNDKIRFFASGKGSHDVVAKGIERWKAATGKAVLRGTISAGDESFGESMKHLMDDLGGTTVAFEPASGTTTCGQGIDAASMEKIKAEWVKIADDFSDHVKKGELKPIGNLVKLLYQIHRRKRTVYGCTAGYGNVAVDPSGDIYPCHRFVGESDWKMGNVHDGSFKEEIQSKFANNTVDQREPCKSCWVRYTCGGRCAHEAMEATGRISSPDPLRCDLVRHLTQLALKLYVRLKPFERSILFSARATAA